MSRHPEPEVPTIRESPVIGPAASLLVAASAVCVLVLLGGVLNSQGVSSRWRPPSDVKVVWVDRAADLPRAWEDAGVENALLVDASAALGFQAVPFGAQVAVPNAYPLPAFEYRDAILTQADATNYVWIAAQRGLVRSVHHVLPQAVLAQRVAEGRRLGYPGISANGSRVTANNDGYWRVVAADVPPLGEAAVLNIDASYFTEGDARGLAASLQRSGLDYRLVTLNRSLDDTRTGDAARAELSSFAQGLVEPQ